MAYPAYIREKARELRTKGLTLDELVERLALPRTTIYYWISDMPLDQPFTARRSRAQLAAARANRARARRRREDAYFRGHQEFSALSADRTFRDFVTIYMTEGYRRCRNTVSVANSDVSIVRLAAYWIRRLTSNKVSYAVHYHADQDLDALKRYWASELGVDPSGIRVQAKSNSNQLKGRTWRSVHGVLHIRVGDTMLRSRLQAWMDCMRDQWLHSGEVGA